MNFTYSGHGDGGGGRGEEKKREKKTTLHGRCGCPH